jgi:hypothetical protein
MMSIYEKTNLILFSFSVRQEGRTEKEWTCTDELEERET